MSLSRYCSIFIREMLPTIKKKFGVFFKRNQPASPATTASSSPQPPPSSKSSPKPGAGHPLTTDDEDDGQGGESNPGMSRITSLSISRDTLDAIEADDICDDEYDDEKNTQTFGEDLLEYKPRQFGIRDERERMVDVSVADLLSGSPKSSMVRLDAKQGAGREASPPAGVTTPPPPGLEKAGSVSAKLLFSASTKPQGVCFKGLMNMYDRELVTKIHIGQLRTEQPMVEDFYYQALLRRATKRSGGEQSTVNSTTSFLPLPRMTQRTRERRAHATPGGLDMRDLRQALGTISSGSSRKPRQSIMSPSLAPILSDEHAKSGISAALLEIEACYRSVLLIEDDLLSGHAVDTADPKHVQTVLNYIGNPDHLAHFLSYGKGRVLVGRALCLLGPKKPAVGRLFFAALVECLSRLPFIREASNKPDPAADHFITAVLAPAVPCLAASTWMDVFVLVDRMLDPLDSLFDWVAKTKAGLVFTCIIMSRAELLKNSSTGSDENDARRWTEFYVDAIYTRLADRLLDFFAFQSSGSGATATLSSSTSIVSSDITSHSYYIWQFMALLSLNVDDERKRLVVMDLRERILSIIEEGDATEIRYLNVFLNALGLDAEQLK